MTRPERLTERFILTDDELEAFEAINSAALDAFQRVGEVIAATFGELAQALDKTQDDFTLKDGGPK